MSRRLIIAAALVVAVVAVVLIASGGGGSGSGYRVRAIFDNGAFMVNGEQVRVAGANVGTIESVDVTMPGETVAYGKDGKPISVPGKAVIVMDITDPGFQDFRSDASCLIRPQSLIGEKFVDCRPTLPRAPGSQAGAAAETDPLRPARRRRVPAAAGQQRHQRRPRPDQRHPDPALRAALPADLQRTRRRPGRPRRRHRSPGQARQPGPARRRPALRDPLRPARPPRPAGQRLGDDPAARSRASAPTSPASSPTPAPPPRPAPNAAPQLEASLRKFPTFLRELRLTMGSLQDFSDAAAPGLHRPRQGGALADRRDPNADPVLGSDHGGAEEPRQRRRSLGPDLRAKPTRS